MMNKYQQIHNKNCGIVVLQKIYNYFYKKDVSISTIKANVNYDQNGINILELKSIATKIGLDLTPIKGNLQSLFKIELKEPLIAIIKSNINYFHYIVIEKILKDKIVFFDPLVGKRKITKYEFSKLYTEIIIRTKKVDNFKLQPNKNQVELLDFEYKKEKAVLSISSLTVLLISFLLALYFKIIIDSLLNKNEMTKILMISLIFMLMTLLKIIVESISNFLIYKLELKYQLFFIKTYLTKISTIQWIRISNYDESTHLKNLELIVKISSFKARCWQSIIVDPINIIFSSIFLIILNAKIFMLLFGASFLMILVMHIFKNKLNIFEINNIIYSTKTKKYFLNIINGIKNYKITNSKFKMNSKFYFSFEETILNQRKSVLFASTYSALITVIKNVIPYLIVIIFSQTIWLNKMQIGQLIIFLSMSSFFMGPLISFVSLFMDISINKQYVENFNSFMILENDTNYFANNHIDSIKKIEINNLKFHYVTSQSIINIHNLVISENTHIIGKNGSGKSTLLKLISTLIVNENILYNEKIINYYSLDKLREQILFISGSDYLPFGTVFDYLTNAENNESTSYFLENINKFNLVEILNKCNLELHTQIDENGKNLSSGQRQLILLMKIFSSNYSLVLLDEAFENIDNEIAIEIKKQIRELLKNKILIEISHRNNYVNEIARIIDCDQLK